MEAENAEHDNTNAAVQAGTLPQLTTNSLTVVLRLQVRNGVMTILRLPIKTFWALVYIFRQTWITVRNNIVVRRICFEIVDGIDVISEELLPYRTAAKKCIERKLVNLRKLIASYCEIMRYYWGTCTWRNFQRCIRILRVYDKLPYDQVDWFAYRFPEHRKPKFRKGQVCVRLRWRKGPVGTRAKRVDPWVLHESLMITECFPVDSDGSLRIDQILKKWNIDELEFLIPGRWDLFTPSDPNRLSPLAIYTLTQQHGYITVVEHEDRITRARNSFSYWYKASFAGYMLRMFTYLMWILLLSAIVGHFSLNHCKWSLALSVVPLSLFFFLPERRVYGCLMHYHKDFFL